MAHILVIGASGPSGLAFAEAALLAQHHLTLYIKAPGKLPGTIGSHPHVKVSVYDSLDDYECLDRVLGCGANVFVSLLGPEEDTQGTPVTDLMKFIFPLLLEYRYERALILGTTAFTAPEDKGGLAWRASTKLSKMTHGDVFRDFAALGAFVSSQPADPVKWTLFRIHHLTEGSPKPVTATYIGTGEDSKYISRKSMVNWIVREMVRGEWIGKTPVICNY